MYYTSDEIFIDGGCFDAGTIAQFQQWNGGLYSRVFAFEPAEVLFKECKGIVKANGYRADIINAGLYSFSGKVSFNSNIDGNARIDENGIDSIQVTSLDEFLEKHGERVTFIKMDIEGSEMEALKGCVQTINRDHPKLAICIYHRMEDLWEIPFWIIKNFPQYRIYVGHHAPTHCETVLYARWEERDTLID